MATFLGLLDVLKDAAIWAMAAVIIFAALMALLSAVLYFIFRDFPS